MKLALRLSIAFCVVQAVAFQCCADATTQPAHSTHIPTTQSAIDLNNQAITPLRVADGHKASVLLFIAVDCPISNSYAPAIAELCRQFTPYGIDFFTVYANAGDTSAAARAHHEQYGFPCEALLDPSQKLAHIVQATRTPEVAVIGPEGTMLYRGRIDDQFVVVGRKRFSATTHELLDVLDAIAAGKPVETMWMSAVGCEIN